ncbi:MAG: DsbA family protein [Anaerolineales bacterium]|nr:DsbA family protein [Chloroflexota bacterium]MBL6982811.1 DsbA family protein [Anaerolineales bacterium]
MQKRSAIQERRRKQKKQQRMTTILIVSGIALIVAAILMLPTIQRSLTPLGEIIEVELNPRPDASGNAMGDPNAPVVIEEFSDFGCGHCGNFATSTGELIADTYVADGQVYFISRSVGSMLNQTTSPKLSEAAYCAGDQNKYWEYHDLIYANQIALYSSNNAPVDRYIELFATAVEIDLDAFSACLDGGKFTDQVAQDQLDAVQAGINSTPSFSINGQLLIGNRPVEDFQAAIDAALSE